MTPSLELEIHAVLELYVARGVYRRGSSDRAAGFTTVLQVQQAVVVCVTTLTRS